MNMLQDADGVIRCRSSSQQDGGVLVEIRDDDKGKWFKLFKISFEDTLTTRAL
jgi:hypothetical protein